MPALTILILAALALRFIIAYGLLPGSGFEADLGTFTSWALRMVAVGPGGFYAEPGLSDYPPAYMYVLWLLGSIGSFIGAADGTSVAATMALLKIPPILADAAVGWLLFVLARRWFGDRPRAEVLALLAAALYLFNPVTWYDSAIWGQVDAIGALLSLATVALLVEGHAEAATATMVVAGLAKPQYGVVLVPIVAVVLLRRHLLEPGSGPIADRGPAWYRRWCERETGLWRLVSAAAAGAVVMLVLIAPFGMDLPGLVVQYGKAAGTYPWLTVNALNPWALLGSGGDAAMAEAGYGRWSSDIVGLLGPVPGVLVGTALLAGGFLVGLALLVRRADRLAIILAAAYLCLAFFILPTRVHERYFFPVFAFLPLLAILDRRYLVATLLLSLSTFINLHGVLSTPFWATPNLEDVFFGPDFRTYPVVVLSALVTTGVFAFLFWQVVRATVDPARSLAGEAPPTRDRAGAAGGSADQATAGPAGTTDADLDPNVAHARDLAALGAVADAPWLDEIQPHRPPPPSAPAAAMASGAVSGATAPSAMAAIMAASDTGWLARGRTALRRQLGSGLRRRDRSASLADERPGRIDRLDLLLALLIVVSALTLRGWRVEEPYDMYFDEVYHARTATEFLQDWRYGEPHAIYEYTHPHLAKYLMAAGIVLFGDDQVSATSQLGFAPRDAVVERRWDETETSSGRAGDRIYVSGDGGIRAYDLATRQLVATIALDGTAEPDSLAIDAAEHRLLIADRAGDLWAFETRALDDVRAGDDPASVEPPYRLGALGAPARVMIVDKAGGQLWAGLEDDRVSLVDLVDGSLLAETTVGGLAGLAATGGGQRLVVDMASVDDPGSLAETLAGILADDATRIRGLLVGADGPVTIVPALDADQAINVQDAIDAAEIPGASIRTGDLLAVAAEEGIVLLDAGTLSHVETFVSEAPVSAVVRVEGPAEPTLYATTGSHLMRIEVKDAQAPSERDDVWMPADVRDLVYDPATQLLHVLGKTIDGDGSTVYVVEPHGNAVFADAPLPAAPAAWALDADPDRPSSDREQLLSISSSGQMASVEVGQHAFGWRFPGVILGALTAGLLYLLARVLFRRRSVGLMVGGLVLLEGMAFAQSRIAMNDVYVGAFIVAAYLVFALLWLGSWRGWSAMLLGLPLLGLLLGLALAAKWVGLYAIGGVILLILLRSALGRALALAAMVLMTGFLGWLAVSSPTSSTPDPLGTIVLSAVAAAATWGVLRLVGVGRMAIAVATLFAAVAVPVLVSVGGNGVFLVLMIGLTLLLAVAIVVRPIRCSLEEARFAVAAPAVLGIVGILVALLGGPLLGESGAAAATGLLALSLVAVATSVAVFTGFAMAGSRGLGPLARGASLAESAGTADGSADLVADPEPGPSWPPDRLPASSPPSGWLRPGWRLGVPWLWALACVAIIPLGVYIASYAPWVELGNRWLESVPAGHEGQTLLALHISMYEYHDNLRATHAASSPWWAWPFDLKPVWFYLGNLASGWTALIYDAGNLVTFWLSVPAMAWVGLMAWRRRSLALTLILVGFACQWLPWARIDRATFQYHYYTSLPFVLLALGYFLAELWHGPSARTWLVARASVAVMLVAVPILWLLRVPLCAISGVARVKADSQACGYVSEAFVLTERMAVSLLIIGVGIVVLAWQSHTLGLRRRTDPAGGSSRLPAGWPWLLVTAVMTAIALAIAQTRFAETPAISAPIGDLGPYVGGLLLLGPLAVAAWLALGARDPRRFVIGVFGAMAMWFVVFQPDIAALPVPTGLARLFQTLPLPTYNYDFQFAVNTAGATETSIVGIESLALTAMVAFLAGAAMYAAYAWRAGGWAASAADIDEATGGLPEAPRGGDRDTR